MACRALRLYFGELAQRFYIYWGLLVTQYLVHLNLVQSVVSNLFLNYTILTH
jgi:hypothetical protein